VNEQLTKVLVAALADAEKAWPAARRAAEGHGPDGPSLALTAVSPDGEEGYPGMSRLAAGSDLPWYKTEAGCWRCPIRELHEHRRSGQDISRFDRACNARLPAGLVALQLGVGGLEIVLVLREPAELASCLSITLALMISVDLCPSRLKR
jgi:hypothetical protein